MILFGLLAAEPKLQDKEPVMWLFLTWSTIEMIRSVLTIIIIISYHILDLKWQNHLKFITDKPKLEVLMQSVLDDDV